jgi:hypothetical protein
MKIEGKGYNPLFRKGFLKLKGELALHLLFPIEGYRGNLWKVRQVVSSGSIHGDFYSWQCSPH